MTRRDVLSQRSDVAVVNLDGFAIRGVRVTGPAPVPGTNGEVRRYNITFVGTRDSAGGASLIEVESSYTFVPGTKTRAEIAEGIRVELARLVLHEVEEWMTVDGVHAFDPHGRRPK